MEYAKAIAGAAAVIVSFVVGEIWIDLPDAVTLALATVLTPAAVAITKNKQPTP